jgi:hypothetical protein
LLVSYEEEETCMSYEEEDTCMSYEEEDTCMSYEEEDTCMSYEEEDRCLRAWRGVLVGTQELIYGTREHILLQENTFYT